MRKHKCKSQIYSNIQVEPCCEVMSSHFTGFTTKCVKHLVALST